MTRQLPTGDGRIGGGEAFAKPTDESELQTGASASLNIQAGNYHDLSLPKSGGDVSDMASISPEKDTLDRISVPLGDPYDDSFYADVANESKSESKGELASVVTNLFDITSGGSITHTWKDNTGRQMFEFDGKIPNPQDEGGDKWKWFTVYSWVGRGFDDEIRENGRHRVTIQHDFGPTRSQEFTVEGPEIQRGDEFVTVTEGESANLSVTLPGANGREVDVVWLYDRPTKPDIEIGRKTVKLDRTGKTVELSFNPLDVHSSIDPGNTINVKAYLVDTAAAVSR